MKLSCPSRLLSITGEFPCPMRRPSLVRRPRRGSSAGRRGGQLQRRGQGRRGFLGDRASKGAFRDIVENWRKPLRKSGDDPFGDSASEDLTRKEFDDAAGKGDLEAAGVVQVRSRISRSNLPSSSGAISN